MHWTEDDPFLDVRSVCRVTSFKEIIFIYAFINIKCIVLLNFSLFRWRDHGPHDVSLGFGTKYQSWLNSVTKVFQYKLEFIFFNLLKWDTKIAIYYSFFSQTPDFKMHFPISRYFCSIIIVGRLLVLKPTSHKSLEGSIRFLSVKSSFYQDVGKTCFFTAKNLGKRIKT